MAKEKKQKQINLEEITALTKELFHAHYAGDLERWFDYLCPDSIYLGTGEPMLFGGSAIREHFKGFEGRAVDVYEHDAVCPQSADGTARRPAHSVSQRQSDGVHQSLYHSVRQKPR
ncbi:hypothetical protein [Clostridium sp. MCC328]|uniref:hypothetical protein n=1 Tax=Clostridium sp. MCC328 TaxID=2592642 RepID=UPI002079E9B9|nr:hypothetical protein [Clostridium sp. MCC328]